MACQLSGCNGGDGRGIVEGHVSIKSCTLEKDSFNLDVHFFAATYFDDTLLIRIQSNGDLPVYADGMVIEIRDVTSIMERLEEPIEVPVVPDLETFLAEGPTNALGPYAGVPLTPYDSPARVTLFLNDTCPGNQLAFTDGTGTLVFESIYHPDTNDVIRGTFDLVFIDPRTWIAPGQVEDRANLTGSFEFDYDRTAQEQVFP